MSKKVIVDKIADKLGLTQKAAAETLDAVAEAIKETVESSATGSLIRIPPLGNFKKVHRAERAARNPQTGEAITIAAHDAIVFKQSKKG